MLQYRLLQIKSLLLSHHHSTCALVSEILERVLQTVQKQFTYRQYILTQKTMCRMHIHIVSTHSVLLDILAVINTHYTQNVHILHYVHLQWGKKVFSQPPIVQVLPLKKMREACNFHHRYTSTMRDKIRKQNPENHIVGFLNNLFANYGGK